MSWLFFALATTFLWGLAELFYKKGAREEEKYAHLKICVCVGTVMGLHAVFTLLTQDIHYDPVNLLRYLPVSLCYMISMAFSYFGMRFLEESISDPIENTGAVFAAFLAMIFLHEIPSTFSLIGIAVVVVGVVGVGFVENSGDTQRKRHLGKKMAIVAFCMPFIYALLDALGGFLDIFYLESDIASTPLVGVTEATIEDVANTSYELTFAFFALVLYIFMRIKKVKFGSPAYQKDKWLSAAFETAGQFTYVYALSGNGIIAAPIISSVCVVSLLLSRIFLKEKLSRKTYFFIAIVIIGILMLAVSDELS